MATWTTFSRYFSDALAGEYIGTANPDDFFADYLEERTNAHRPDPVSAFAAHVRAGAGWTRPGPWPRFTAA